MEVAGKRGDSEDSQAPSLDISNIGRVLFQPCATDNESFEANGFCKNCQEYLCGTCIKYHRKVTVSKHHTILDKANMPMNVVPDTVKQLCTETCERHKLETIKFYCKNHDMVGCGNCMVIDYKACKVEFIPDIADKFIDGEEFKTILDDLEMLKMKVESKLLKNEDDKQVCYEEYDAAIKDIRQLRKDIDEYLNRMEQLMMNDCERLRKDNEKVINESNDFVNGIKSELDEITVRFKSKSKNKADMFVAAKQISVHQLDKNLKQIDDGAFIHLSFQRNNNLDRAISENFSLGQLVKHSPAEVSIGDFEPVFSHDIFVKSKTDKENVRISNMLPISSDILVCVDRNNESLKVVDIKQNVIVSQTVLQSGPWDITYIPTDQIAVTLPDIKKINFLTVRNNKLSLVREIDVKGQCRGIHVAYHENTLVVSFVEPSNLQILTMNGEIIKSVNTDNISPRWLTCLLLSNCGDYFFVSDHHKDCVWKLSFEGEVLATYKDKDLTAPRSIAECKDGSLLVCSSGNNQLHLMSQDCRKLGTFTFKNVGLKILQSVCYSEATSTLHLSDYEGDYVMVYKQTLLTRSRQLIKEFICF